MGVCSGPGDFSWDTPWFFCCEISQVLLLPVVYQYSDNLENSRLLDALADLSEWLSSIVVFSGSGPQTRHALSSHSCCFLPIWSLCFCECGLSQMTDEVCAHSQEALTQS